MVLVPGHGQTVEGARQLVATLARLGRTGIAWGVDPTPAAGGDLVEAQAIAAIVRRRLATEFPGAAPRATIVGWSHGGGEALRAARADAALFGRYLGLCPAGMVTRRPLEMVGSFVLEAARIMAGYVRRGRWSYLGETLRVGLDLGQGLILDLVRGRSLRRLVEDVGWACRRVPGPDFDYPGEVILVFGKQDTVIRWRDVFPGCNDVAQLAEHLPTYREENLPRARRVEVLVLEGNHMSPETEAEDFVGPALALLGEGED
jgi:pimeloyl-ACP methyl ester carboxylesterase